MHLQLLPSTFDGSSRVSFRQHLSCFVVDDSVAIDAGSLAMAASADQRDKIRDVVLTHAHLDHVAGLPLFVDDLFATLHEPIRVHATAEVIEVLEKNIFNWDVYPRFSELHNANGPVMTYEPFEIGREFNVKHLRFRAIGVNHKVPAVGFLISDSAATIALTSDTAEMNGFWDLVNLEDNLKAVLIECAFPNELNDLAAVSHHLTPASLNNEMAKLKQECPILVINLKPMYRREIVAQLSRLGIRKLEVLSVGQIYRW